jgi:hypothetical protein
MGTRSLVLSAIGLLIAARLALGDPTGQVCTVYVEHIGADSVGARIALGVKDRLTASPRFRLVEAIADAAFRIQIVSMDIEKDGRYSAVAFAYGSRVAMNTNLSFFINTGVGVYPSSGVREAAESIVANLDKQTSGMRDICGSQSR